MKLVEEVIEIEASRRKVWEYLIKQKEAKEWDPGVESVKYLTNKKEGKGTKTFYKTKRLFGIKTEFLMDITEWKNGNRIKFVNVLRKPTLGVKEVYGDWKLEETYGKTKFTWKFNFKTDSIPIKIMSPIFRYMTKKAVRMAMKGLKEKIEKVK